MLYYECIIFLSIKFFVKFKFFELKNKKKITNKKKNIKKFLALYFKD